MPDEVGERLTPRTAGDLGDAQVLGQEQVADGVDRAATRLCHHLGQRAALPAQVLGLGEGAKAQVRPAGGAGVGGAACLELLPQAVPDPAVREAILQWAGSPGLHPLRQLDQEAGRGPLVGIRIEGDVHSVLPRVIDQGEQLLGAAGMGLPMVEVRQVDRPIRSPPDLDRLAKRVQEAVPEGVPDVRVIEAAGSRRFAGQRGQLIGRGIRAGWVVQAARDPERTLGHRLAQHRPHVGEAPVLRGRVVPADGADAERAVSDHDGDVHCLAPVVSADVARHGVPVMRNVRPAVEPGVEIHEGGEVRRIGERRIAIPIHADHFGRHALAHLRLVARIGQDHQPAVRVEVDESGRDHHAGRVDRATG